ncbi:MAG: DinB family protein [Chloroflexi bacterium]|nr:DinB family protein [Chloroflexota bacterium]
MQLAELILLFDYHDWATERLLAAAARLEEAPPQELLATLAHICEAQRAWRMLLTRGRFDDFLQPADYANLAAVRTLWQREKAELWRYLRSLDDSDIEREFDYEGDAGLRRRLVWHCLWHVVNHGTQHRSECAALLTDLGSSPGDLDFPIFLDEVAGAVG